MTLPKEKGQEFLIEIEKLCHKYGISISHEDSHGAFLLEEYDEELMAWLREASYGLYKSE